MRATWKHCRHCSDIVGIRLTTDSSKETLDLDDFLNLKAYDVDFTRNREYFVRHRKGKFCHTCFKIESNVVKFSKYLRDRKSILGLKEPFEKKKIPYSEKFIVNLFKDFASYRDKSLPVVYDDINQAIYGEDTPKVFRVTRRGLHISQSPT